MRTNPTHVYLFSFNIGLKRETNLDIQIGSDNGSTSNVYSRREKIENEALYHSPSSERNIYERTKKKTDLPVKTGL